MKYVLAAMCAIVVLFMGGCALIASGAGPIALLPAGITALNLAILGGLFRWKVQWRPAFYILGVIDVLLAAVIAVFASSALNGRESGFAGALLAIAGVILLKGVLSFVYAKTGQTEG